jgi:hypothetical protein
MKKLVLRSRSHEALAIPPLMISKILLLGLVWFAEEV